MIGQGARRPRSRPRLLPLALAGTLGAGAALLVACGNAATSPALIPPASAGTLKSDFDAVAAAVAAGSCSQGLTKALVATRKDLAALPSALDAQLLAQLQRGVNTLSDRAHAGCTPQTTATTPTTNSTPTTTSTQTNPTTNTNTSTNTTTPTNTDTTGTTTTPANTNPGPATTNTDTTATTPPNTGGGTPAPQGQSGQVSPGAGAQVGAGGTLGNGGGGN